MRERKLSPLSLSFSHPLPPNPLPPIGENKILISWWWLEFHSDEPSAEADGNCISSSLKTGRWSSEPCHLPKVSVCTTAATKSCNQRYSNNWYGPSSREQSATVSKKLGYFSHFIWWFFRMICAFKGAKICSPHSIYMRLFLSSVPLPILLIQIILLNFTKNFSVARYVNIDNDGFICDCSSRRKY